MQLLMIVHNMETQGMARGSKMAAVQERRTRKRLTIEQKSEIAQAIAKGESGNVIAERLGVSAATVYAQKRKAGTISAGAMPQTDSDLRRQLVNFAVRTLLGQSVPQDERDMLEKEVNDELIRRVAAGI